MTQHTEKKWLPYSPQQLYDIVERVEEYPHFLPWCTRVSVRERQQDLILADMSVGYHFFQERFTSEVRLLPHSKIDVAFREGPFRYLNNHWIFEGDHTGCTVDFFIDFELRARALQTFMNAVFDKAAHRMFHAFEKRAQHLYGIPQIPAPQVL